MNKKENRPINQLAKDIKIKKTCKILSLLGLLILIIGLGYALIDSLFPVLPPYPSVSNLLLMLIPLAVIPVIATAIVGMILRQL